jgi:hypothetical protein
LRGYNIRITRIATDRDSSTVESVSFSVDRNLVKMLRPGDVVNVTYELEYGLGLSIVRRDHLLCALGDVCHLPWCRWSARDSVGLASVPDRPLFPAMPGF